MKLSTAIRIGSMTTKQITGYPTDGGNGRCALGAALHAVNVVPNMTLYFEQLDIHFPISATWVVSPINGKTVRLSEAIWALNDDEGWSRERIADWVETIELKEEQAANDVKTKEAVNINE